MNNRISPVRQLNLQNLNDAPILGKKKDTPKFQKNKPGQGTSL